jgi:hypothetical protein
MFNNYYCTCLRCNRSHEEAQEMEFKIKHLEEVRV